MLVSKLFVLFATTIVAASGDHAFSLHSSSVSQCETETNTLFTTNPDLQSAYQAWETAFEASFNKCDDATTPYTKDMTCAIDANAFVVDTYDYSCVNAVNSIFAPGVFKEIPTFFIICTNSGFTYNISVSNLVGCFANFNTSQCSQSVVDTAVDGTFAALRKELPGNCEIESGAMKLIGLIAVGFMAAASIMLV